MNLLQLSYASSVGCESLESVTAWGMVTASVGLDMTTCCCYPLDFPRKIVTMIKPDIHCFQSTHEIRLGSCLCWNLPGGNLFRHYPCWDNYVVAVPIITSLTPSSLSAEVCDKNLWNVFSPLSSAVSASFPPLILLHPSFAVTAHPFPL